ncbi:MAG: NAD-dependent succinate-semialdehyde dehydrogenase [Salinivirgaceae bacterium]|nr:NAD-dependent succinate-semialdehyde dehydrogenase [Salinivirgaceae bacterium]
MYKTQNPFTQVVEKEFDSISNDVLDEKLSLANSAYAKWRAETFQTKSKLLYAVANLLEERKDAYGRIITTEMGKPISQATAEVEKCAWVCRYYAENAIDFLKPRRIESSASLNQIVYEPMGAIFAIMPWNFPFWQVFRFIAPTLMAGNVGLLKHASNVPQCAQLIEQVFIDAGAPEGLIQNLFIDYNQVETVIASRTVKAVTLTGSNNAGSKVAQLAGKYTKKSVLELGGSDPFIVFDDADLNKALENAVLSRFLNNGQSCIAAKRFIVHESIAEEFIANFQSLVENFIIGNPLDGDTFIGPMVNQSAIDELLVQVDASHKKGAVILTGGTVHEDMKTIFLPTIMVNVKRDMPVWKEEVFGPLAVIVVFSSDEEAIELANDTIFGLAASVWTDDSDKASYICKNIHAGTVAINGMVKSDPALPFGGINESGYGRELSDYGICEFVNIKTVSYF